MTDCLSIHDRSSRQTINSIHNTSPNAYITILVYLFHCVSSINAMFKNFSLGQVLIHWWTKPPRPLDVVKVTVSAKYFQLGPLTPPSLKMFFPYQLVVVRRTWLLSCWQTCAPARWTVAPCLQITRFVLQPLSKTPSAVCLLSSHS